MSLLFSALGFVAQLCVIASVISVIVSSVSLPQNQACAYVDDLDATLLVEYQADNDTSVPSSSASFTYQDTDGSFGMSCLMVAESTTDDLSLSTVKELRLLAKERGLRGVSNLRKAELVAAIYDSYLFS